MIASQFSDAGFTLATAIDRLMGYDRGSNASGSDSPSLKAAVRQRLEDMADDEHRRFCASYARAFLSESAIAQGHGIEDVVEFAGWLERLTREG